VQHGKQQYPGRFTVFCCVTDSLVRLLGCTTRQPSAHAAGALTLRAQRLFRRCLPVAQPTLPVFFSYTHVTFSFPCSIGSQTLCAPPATSWACLPYFWSSSPLWFVVAEVPCLDLFCVALYHGRDCQKCVCFLDCHKAPENSEDGFVWEEGSSSLDTSSPTGPLSSWCQHVSVTKLYISALVSSVAAAIHVFGCLVGHKFVAFMPAPTLAMYPMQQRPRGLRACASYVCAKIDVWLWRSTPVYSAVPLPNARPLVAGSSVLPTASPAPLAPRVYSNKGYVGFGSKDVEHLRSLLPHVSAQEAFVPARGSSSPVVPSVDTTSDAYLRFLSTLTLPSWKPASPTTPSTPSTSV
jgi:hypothetical protein